MTNITVDIQGCSSVLDTSLSGALLGPNDGTPTGEVLRRDVTGKIDLLDPQCRDAQVELILNETELIGSTSIDQDTGTVNFAQVELPEGQINLGLRVRLNDCLLYTSPSPRDVEESRMPSSA